VANDNLEKTVHYASSFVVAVDHLSGASFLWFHAPCFRRFWGSRAGLKLFLTLERLMPMDEPPVGKV